TSWPREANPDASVNVAWIDPKSAYAVSSRNVIRMVRLARRIGFRQLSRDSVERFATLELAFEEGHPVTLEHPSEPVPLGIAAVEVGGEGLEPPPSLAAQLAPEQLRGRHELDHMGEIRGKL